MYIYTYLYNLISKIVSHNIISLRMHKPTYKYKQYFTDVSMNSNIFKSHTSLNII